MSETRQIFCKSDPTELLAEITLPDKTSEEQWFVAIEGYYCTEHDVIPEPIEPLDVTVKKLVEELAKVKEDVEELKP